MISPGDLPPAGPDPTLGLAAIAGADAGFDRDLFMDSARATFVAVKRAVEARDLGPVGGSLGPGVRATLQAQIDRLLEQKAVHHFENLSIDGMAIARAEHGADFDTIAVRVDARAAQFAEDEARRQLIFGSHAITPFIEFWTYTRRAGVDTGGPAAPPTCANCGAPVTAADGDSCRYCRAALPARQTIDWMVSAIQDPIDFRV